MLVEETPAGLAKALRRPAPIIIADMSMPGLDPARFCHTLRQHVDGEDSYALFLATPDQEQRALELIAAKKPKPCSWRTAEQWTRPASFAAE